MRVLRRGSKALAIAAAAYLVLMGLAWGFQRRFIYLPARGAPPPVERALPGAREVAFETEDGLRLAAWLLPTARQPPRSSVIVFHGNAGDRASRAPLARALADGGHDVLLVDYRGYAENPGSPSEGGLVRDARAARAWVAARSNRPIVLFGESLGAAVAVALAAEQPSDALALRSPFTSLADAGRAHYPFLPLGLILKDRWSSIERIAHVGVPVLVVAGTSDGVVPFEQSRALFDAAREPKRFTAIEGADHNDVALLAGREMIDAILAFLAEHVPE